ncbi:hypothetical protein C0557_01795 [Kosakonia sp. MUSA4]|nr:hypothetical protein C0557_01795 [Kosakonia sp. MUSA4]
MLGRYGILLTWDEFSAMVLDLHETTIAIQESATADNEIVVAAKVSKYILLSVKKVFISLIYFSLII